MSGVQEILKVSLPLSSLLLTLSQPTLQIYHFQPLLQTFQKKKIRKWSLYPYFRTCKLGQMSLVQMCLIQTWLIQKGSELMTTLAILGIAKHVKSKKHGYWCCVSCRRGLFSSSKCTHLLAIFLFAELFIIQPLFIIIKMPSLLKIQPYTNSDWHFFSAVSTLVSFFWLLTFTLLPLYTATVGHDQIGEMGG